MQLSDRIATLSPREKDCLRLVLETDSHKHIAQILGIAPNTVSGHLKSAIKKLGVSSSVRGAQLLTAYEAGQPPQSWGDHPRPLPPDSFSAQPEPAFETPDGPPSKGSRALGLARKWLRLPAQRGKGRHNDLTIPQRLRETFQAALFAIFAIGVLVAALSGLGIVARAYFGKH